MNIRCFVWFLLVFVLISGIFAAADATTVGPDGDDTKFDAKAPEWENAADFTDSQWGLIIAEKNWDQIGKVIASVPEGQINDIEPATLASNWKDVPHKEKITAKTLAGVMKESTGDLSLKGVSTEQIQIALAEKYTGITGLDTVSNDKITITSGGLLSSGTDSLPISTVQHQSFSITVDKDGNIKIVPPVESAEETPDEEGVHTETVDMNAKPLTVDLSGQKPADQNFNMEIPSTATESAIIKLGNGKLIHVHPGSNVRVEKGKVIIQPSEQGRLSITGQETDIVTISAGEKPVSAYVNEPSPKDEHFINFKPIVYADGDKQTTQQSFTINGAGFHTTYQDLKTGTQTIKLDESKSSTLEVFQLPTGSAVHVTRQGGRIFIGSLIRDTDRFAKVPHDFTGFSMPSNVRIAADISPTGHPEEYTWDKESENFIGTLKGANFDVKITQSGTLADVIKNRQTTSEGYNQPTEDELYAFLARGYGVDADTIKQNSDAQASSFPPDIKERQVTKTDTNIFITYNNEGTIKTLTVTDTNGDGKLDNQDIMNTGYLKTGKSDLTDTDTEFKEAIEFLEEYGITEADLIKDKATRSAVVESEGGPIIAPRAVIYIGDESILPGITIPANRFYSTNPNTWNPAYPITAASETSYNGRNLAESVGKVSSGEGDYGGVSYGLYQFASRTKQNEQLRDGTEVHLFIKQLPDGQMKNDLIAAWNTHNSNTFKTAWQKTANQNTNEFGYYQEKFMVEYQAPIKLKTYTDAGINLNTIHPSTLDILIGSANQYTVSQVKNQANLLRQNGGSELSDVQIITFIQDHKARNVQSNFQSSSFAVRESVAQRIQREKSQALAAISQNPSQPSSNFYSVVGGKPITTKYVTDYTGSASIELKGELYQTATNTRERPTCISSTSLCARYASNYLLNSNKFGYSRENARALPDQYIEEGKGTVVDIDSVKPSQLKENQIIITESSTIGHALVVVKDPKTSQLYISELYTNTNQPTTINIRDTNYLATLQANYGGSIITPN